MRKRIETRLNSADFESVDVVNAETGAAVGSRVWAWGVQDIHALERYDTGTDIESFIKFILHSPSITYFHNLAFDGAAFLTVLRQRSTASESFTASLCTLGRRGLSSGIR